MGHDGPVRAPLPSSGGLASLMQNRGVGTPPRYLALTNYQRFCWRVLGRTILTHYRPRPQLELQLQRSRVPLRAEEYMAYLWMSTLLVLLASLLCGLALAMLGPQACIAQPVIIAVIAVPPLATAAAMISLPSSRAKARGRDMDRHIGPAMGFISAMASADVSVDVIFKELAKQNLYGEIGREAEWIVRDNELLGMDMLTAIGRAARRAPSAKLQEFLQGVVTTSTTGGELKAYFLQKAEHFESEGKLEVRARMDALGMMAEAFVTVVVAFPLFLVVVLAIMAIVPGGGNPTLPVLMLEVVVLVMVPLSQFGFIFYVWNTTKESSC